MTLLTFPTRTTPAPRPLLIKPEKDARWYDHDAQPVLRVPYADPKRRGEMRWATLADARKLGLYPSVTNVLSLISQPVLEAWQASQYIWSALSLERLPSESIDSFAQRVVEDGQAERNQAAEDGQLLHAAIANYLQGRDEYDLDAGEYTAHLRAFGAWWLGSGLRCLASEHRFVNHEYGYGGMVDCVATESSDPSKPEDLLIIDWKTQRTRPGEKVRFYDEWAMQLAAYAHTPGIRLMNVVISRTEPGRIEVKEWSDRERWWASFHACLCLWKLLADYYPGRAA